MKRANRWAGILLAVYGAVMLWLLFGQRLDSVSYADYAAQLAHNYNLIPFRTIAQLIELWTSGRMVSFSIINVIGNIVTFVPLGGLLPCVFSPLRRFGKHTLCVAGIIVAVELVQFVTLLGVGDIDDLILNVIGGMIGWALFRLVEAHRKTINKVDSKDK